MIKFETAREHVTPRVAIAAPGQTVAEVRASLCGQNWECLAEVAICEKGKLLGLVNIEALFAASGDMHVEQVMDRRPPAVRLGEDQEIAAWQAVKHGESALAVVDERDQFQGLIPPRQLLRVLLQEHNEDLARLGGYLHGDNRARLASEEPIPRRLWHRLPWLLVGLFGAGLSADLVGAFHSVIGQNMVLAFFVPGVVYLADAVGTQTETLVIRGLSLGIPIRQIVVRELVTGLLIGVVLCVFFLPFAVVRWHRFDVAVAVSIALLTACSIASAVAMTLPWILQKWGLDPAFGAGPVATVIQDLLSILVYFLVCATLVQ